MAATPNMWPTLSLRLPIRFQIKDAASIAKKKPIASFHAEFLIFMLPAQSCSRPNNPTNSSKVQAIKTAHSLNVSRVERLTDKLSTLMTTPTLQLNPTEVRALGSLIEKDITTPDYYPLSLNALVNACNQKNNRDPIMSLDEDSVRQALGSLQEKRLAGPAGGADSRVTKYEHRLQEVFNFDRREIAVICVLMLRGPQTPGELRSRSERMYHFETLDDVQVTIQRLSDRQPPLVRVLPRQPGTKESRYVHLFAGDIADDFSLSSVHRQAGDLHSFSRRGSSDSEGAFVLKA